MAITDPAHKKIIIDRKWDTVKLISSENGKFVFDSADPLLKQGEGVWKVKSNNIEGECFGYIKQNNPEDYISLNRFRILILLEDSSKIYLPFLQKSNSA